MALAVVNMPSMTITGGGTTSNAVGLIDDSWGLTIYSPATITNTITVEVEPTSTGTNFVTLQSGGTDVTIPAGKATVLNPIPFRQIRVKAAGAEGQQDVFTLTKVILT